MHLNTAKSNVSPTQIQYTVFSIRINNIEAVLLYKYLKIHPVEKRCITEGHFAYTFKDFKQKREFDLMPI
ncbi:hypothetical protein J2772_004773 [Chryseobacterium jejuense]|nr:hypothetical protein [Chryseobacterium jejuense]